MKLKQLPVSEYQKRFFLAWALNPTSCEYNESLVFKVSKQNDRIDKDLLKKCCEIMISEDEIFYSRFDQDGSTCYCYNYLIDNFYQEIELTEDVDIRKYAKELISKPFDLTKDTLLRLYVLSYANSSEYYLIANAHHIICDAVFASTLVNRILAIRNLLISNEKINTDTEHCFKNAVKKEQELLAGKDTNVTKQFWIDTLKDIPLHVDLPQKSILNNKEEDIQEEIYFNLSHEDLAELKLLSKATKSTLFIVLSALYGIVLAKYSNQEKFTFTYPINLRPQGFRDVFGCFVNNVPLIIDLGGKVTISDLISDIVKQRIACKDHQWYSLTDIINDQRKARNEYDSHEWFNVGLIEANLNAMKIDISNMIITSEDINPQKNGIYDLALAYDPRANNGVKCKLLYKKNILEKHIVEGVISCFKKLVHNCHQNKNNKLINICLLEESMYKQVIYDWNNTDTEYSNNKLIHTLFEEQVAKSPNNIAFVYEDIKLTYKELNQRANQLGHYLRGTYQISGDDLIALCLVRSEYMIIAMLAVLKSGAGYVPIDPSYPSERIGFILSDTSAKVVLNNESHLEMLKQLVTKNQLMTNIIAVDSQNIQDMTKQKPIINLSTTITNNNIVYVIYTSGTTGKPKGVVIEHRNLATYANSIVAKLELNENHRSLLVTEYIFDLGYTNIFPILISGGCLYVLNREHYLDTSYVCNYIKDQQINFVKTTPLYIENIVEENIDCLSDLDYLILGGESSNVNLLQKLNEHHIPCINHYGPTESTIGIIINKRFIPGQAYLGKPLSNVKLYVLDNDLNPLPLGSIGELYVGGASVGRGYLNQPELTNEKFIVNPFQTSEEKNKNSCLYKTGDLVRYLPDGNLEYIGRNDFQVKIRGYRIELKEIENTLLKHGDINTAVVIARTDSTTKSLIAYLICGDFTPSTNEIKEFLGENLPNYMIPEQYVILEHLPLTLNGKLDRAALPDPELFNKNTYVAPSSDIETQIVHIWADLLGIEEEHIGIKDNFFSLGGNSILMIKLRSKLAKINCFKNISATDLFKHHTIEKLISSVTQEQNIEIKLQHASTELEHEIAIIASSGAFSGCDDIISFWEAIENKTERVREYSLEECRELGIADNLIQNPGFIPVSGKMANIDLFDPLFWGMSANEAKQTSPTIRKFLEHAWFALERSGYINKRQELNIGVFAGGGSELYFFENVLNGVESENINFWDAHTMNAKDALATKISYFLGLTGPANSINTACSSGLVSVIEACKNLSLRTCDMALAGGVALAMPDQVGYVYQEGFILSKDGHCRTFDKNSSGTAIGSGVGVVILKRLVDAKKDGDKIIAVIKGYATNNDGNRKISYTAPSAIGQTECILNAQRMAKVTSNEIDYVECHGTGTNLGDPIEVQALKEAFKLNVDKNLKRTDKCILGAVKANIGHSSAASGIAGLIKVCLMLEHNIIPGQVNFSEANPELQIEGSDFMVITTNKKWNNDNNQPRLAGVSSFGIGGTNAHIIVGDYVNFAPDHGNYNKEFSVNDNPDENWILPLSAKNRKSLEKYKQKFIEYLEYSNDTLENISYTLQHTRMHFPYRLAIVAKNKTDAIYALNSAPMVIESTDENVISKNKIIFMFPGQGSQYVNMGLELYQNDDYFKQIVDECLKIVNKHISIDFTQILYPEIYGNIGEDINQTKWAQIALFIISYSLSKLLIKLNIIAAEYIGHSIGEYVAATLSGVFSLEDALYLVIKRGNLMQEMPCGSMLSIQSDVKSIVNIISSNKCEIAVINSENNCVAAGSIENIKNLKQILDGKKIASLILNTSHAYHSKMMDEASTGFMNVIKNIKLNTPQIPFISNLSGKFITDAQALSNEYWAAQIRQRVEFNQGIHSLCNHHHNKAIFIEVGAGKGLSSFVLSHKKDDLKIKAIQLLPSKKEIENNNYHKISHIDDLVALLWMHGIASNFVKDNNCVAKMIPDLPCYQFDSKRFWIEKIKTRNSKQKNDIYNTDVNTIKIIEDRYTDLEYKVAQVFCNVLGINEISIYDNFFKLGGNSLLAVSLVSKLKGMGAHIHVNNLLENSNIRNLSTIIDTTDNSANKLNVTHDEIVIPLKLNEKAKQNVFLIHPVGGTVIGYMDLINNLSDQYNYYGIQNINVYGTQLLQVDTLEKLAENYIQEVLKLQPNGDLILMGISMGGTIGFEMSRQLIDMGKKVKNIFMFDSWAYFSDEFRSEERYKAQMAEQKAYSKELKNIDDEMKQNLIDARWNLMQLLTKYIPKKSNVPITLFKAKDLDGPYISNFATLSTDDNGWGEYTNELESYNIEGNHTSILAEQGLEQIIQTINSKFDLKNIKLMECV